MIVTNEYMGEHDTNEQHWTLHRGFMEEFGGEKSPVKFDQNGYASIEDSGPYSTIPDFMQALATQGVNLETVINNASRNVKIAINPIEWTMVAMVHSSCPEEIDELPAAIEFFKLYNDEYSIEILGQEVAEGESYTLKINLVGLLPAVFSFIIDSLNCRGG